MEKLEIGLEHLKGIKEPCGVVVWINMLSVLHLHLPISARMLSSGVISYFGNNHLSDHIYMLTSVIREVMLNNRSAIVAPSMSLVKTG